MVMLPQWHRRDPVSEPIGIPLLAKLPESWMLSNTLSISVHMGTGPHRSWHWTWPLDTRPCVMVQTPNQGGDTWIPPRFGVMGAAGLLSCESDAPAKGPLGTGLVPV